eukprot:242154-Amphidinium_carterae.1
MARRIHLGMPFDIHTKFEIRLKMPLCSHFACAVPENALPRQLWAVVKDKPPLCTTGVLMQTRTRSQRAVYRLHLDIRRAEKAHNKSRLSFLRFNVTYVFKDFQHFLMALGFPVGDMCFPWVQFLGISKFGLLKKH